jgi:hypothetical protein
MKRLVLFLIAVLVLAVVALPALGADDAPACYVDAAGQIVCQPGSSNASTAAPGETRTCTTDPEDSSGLPECGTRADNECNPGGTMEGKCDNEWLWKAGWEIARFNDGRMTREQVNDAWRFLLPPPVEDAGGLPDLAPGCYQPVEDYFDLEYYGPINTIANYTMWSSTDGSCSGDIEYQDVVIYATSESAALVLCETVWGDDDIVVDHLILDYPGIPANFWDCYLD